MARPRGAFGGTRNGQPVRTRSGRRASDPGLGERDARRRRTRRGRLPRVDRRRDGAPHRSPERPQDDPGEHRRTSALELGRARIALTRPRTDTTSHGRRDARQRRFGR
ncbi:hypothetical protein PLANTIT3_80026 [Plantibacter sp. T3]|nr:hypothetical protein PLANTIT3_80026 [Plantibacter sp. T3]